MLNFKDNGIFVKLEYRLPKYHPSAIWIDFEKSKNEPRITFQELIDNLRSYAIVYGNCAIKYVDIKLSNNGQTDEEHSSHGYDFGTFIELLSLTEYRFKLYVEKCIFELIKPLQYQWFEKPKKNEINTIENQLMENLGKMS